jgi:hypothetical protein
VFGRRLAFWVTVGGVAVISQFVVELAADKAPQALGLRRFVAYIHRGPGGQS